MEVLGGASAAQYAALSRDVDELIEAFAICGGSQLERMKEIWRCCGFSFIHEARPAKLEPSRFMQILYSSACVHLSPEKPLLWRLGALYVVYILYETQDHSPKVKIYLSLEHLDWLVSLAQLVKQESDRVPLQIIRYMIRDNAFLYGHTCVTLKKVEESKQRKVYQINERVRLARSRLLSSVPVNEHICGSMASDIGIDESTNMIFQEYNQAKQRIFQRVSGQEQQEHIDINNEINNISKARDEFRTALLRESQESQAQAQTQESTLGDEEFDLDLGQFTGDLESFLDF